MSETQTRKQLKAAYEHEARLIDNMSSEDLERLYRYFNLRMRHDMLWAEERQAQAEDRLHQELVDECCDPNR